jgi:MFS family permease
MIRGNSGCFRPCDLTPEKNPLKLFRLMNPAMKGLLVTDILVRFCEQIPYAFVVVWCMKTIAQPVSALQFGLLTTIEMTTAVLVYIPVAYLADRGTKKPFVLMTFVFFTLFPLVLLYSRSFEWLILAFVLRGLKEFGEPTRKALIMDLSPDHCKAGMFGLYYLIRDVFVSLAALGGALLWQISPETNLVTAFVFGSSAPWDLRFSAAISCSTTIALRSASWLTLSKPTTTTGPSPRRWWSASVSASCPRSN